MSIADIFRSDCSQGRAYAKLAATWFQLNWQSGVAAEAGEDGLFADLSTAF